MSDTTTEKQIEKIVKELLESKETVKVLNERIDNLSKQLEEHIELYNAHVRDLHINV